MKLSSGLMTALVAPSWRAVFYIQNKGFTFSVSTNGGKVSNACKTTVRLNHASTVSSRGDSNAQSDECWAMCDRVALNKALFISGKTRECAADVHLIYVHGRTVSSCLERALCSSCTWTAYTRHAQDGCLTQLTGSDSTTESFVGSLPAGTFGVPINFGHF
jgi:hypothetical protein